MSNMSPVVVRCSQCGSILAHEDSELVDVEVLIKDLNGKCPKCGHLLTLPPETVEVKPDPACKKRLVGDFKHDYHNCFGGNAGSSQLLSFPKGGCASIKRGEVGPGVGKSSRRQPSKPK